MSTLETIQISAHISEATSSELDRYVDARGLKKDDVIEQALRHHLHALRELPPDVIIPPQFVVSTETLKHLADLIAKSPKPTLAMRALFQKK